MFSKTEPKRHTVIDALCLSLAHLNKYESVGSGAIRFKTETVTVGVVVYVAGTGKNGTTKCAAAFDVRSKVSA